VSALQWAKEGGYSATVARVLQVEQAILSLSKNPQALQTAFNELPKDIALKAADHLRLSTRYGPGAGAAKAEQFLNSLTESEFQTVREWLLVGFSR
jgi:hypothetical protein